MSDKKIQTLDDVRAFLEGTTEIDFSIEMKGECYQWIRTTLVRFRYLSLARTQRGLILRYLERVSGYSRQRLPAEMVMAMTRETGKLLCAQADSGWRWCGRTFI